MWNDLIRLFVLLNWTIFFDLKLRRHVFFEAHSSFSIDLLKFWLFGYFFILRKEGILGFPKFLFENKLAPHKKLACNYYVKNTVFIRINIAMLVNV